MINFGNKICLIQNYTDIALVLGLLVIVQPICSETKLLTHSPKKYFFSVLFSSMKKVTKLIEYLFSEG